MLNPEPAGGDVSASFGQPLDQVVSVRGSRARLGLLIPPIEDLDAIRATVGKFLGILTTESLLIGVITNVSIEAPVCAEEPGCQSTADLDLIGEIKHSAAPARVFQRGVTSYPAIGDPVLAVGARELRLVYNDASGSAIGIVTCSRTAASPLTSISTTCSPKRCA
jgi:hypothetical protein